MIEDSQFYEVFTKLHIAECLCKAIQDAAWHAGNGALNAIDGLSRAQGQIIAEIRAVLEAAESQYEPTAKSNRFHPTHGAMASLPLRLPGRLWRLVPVMFYPPTAPRALNYPPGPYCRFAWMSCETGS